MNYEEAGAVRRRGTKSMITDRLLSGQSVGSAIGSSLSDRMKAAGIGLKEKFDPLNIARAVTGGGSLAPALLLGFCLRPS